MAAQQLMKIHHLKQVQAAQLLKVSQPAISHYCRKIRGKAINLENDKEVNNLIQDMTESLVKNQLTRKELTQTICRICRTIRAKGLLCKLHEKFDKTINSEECEICRATDAPTYI
jgi:predicted transcriptional regulator